MDFVQFYAIGLNSLAGERMALTCPETWATPGHMQSMLSEITRICSMARLPGRMVHKKLKTLMQIVAQYVAACASKYFYVVSHVQGGKGVISSIFL